MIAGIKVKVCGITRAADACLAAELGVDYLAFNLHPPSPRYLELGRYAEMVRDLPPGLKRGAVMVEPTLDALDWAQEAGFDYFQIHARHDVSHGAVRGWSEAVGAANLWLAPKLPPGEAFPAGWLDFANTFLMDTFHAEGFGGSGRTGDWAGFMARAREHPEKTWILAGGLGPDNLDIALAASGARFVDVNSGVEESPGIKSHAKLRALADLLRGRERAE